MIVPTWSAALLLITCSLIGMPVAAQSATAAEEEWSCKTCAYNLDTNEHFFNGWFGCSSGEQCKDCKSLNSCHGAPQTPWSCSLNHWGCGASLAASDAVEKARTNPFSDLALSKVVNDMPDRVTVSSAGYVLVKGCNGEVVASYKVSPTTLARLSAHKNGPVVALRQPTATFAKQLSALNSEYRRRIS